MLRICIESVGWKRGNFDAHPWHPSHPDLVCCLPRRLAIHHHLLGLGFRPKDWELGLETPASIFCKPNSWDHLSQKSVPDSNVPNCSCDHVSRRRRWVVSLKLTASIHTRTDFTFVVLRVDFSSRESVRFEVMIDVPIDSTKTGVSTAFWVTFSNPILALLVDWDSRDYGYCVLDTNEPPSTIVFKEWQPSMPESPGFLNHLSPPGPTIGGFIHESNVYAILAWGGALFMGTTYRPSFLTCNRMPPLSNSSNLSPSYLIPVREKDALNGRFHLFLFDASTNHDQREIRRATILGEAIVAGRDMFSFCSLNSLSQEPSPDKTFELTPFRNGGAFSERVGGDMGTGSFLLPSSSGRNAMQVRYQNYAYHSMNLVINRPEGTVVREVKLPAEAQPERYNPSNLGKRIFFDDHLGLIVLGKVGGKIQVLSLR